MAHKTNSKEQFLFKFYNFKFSINVDVGALDFTSTVQGGAHSLNLSYAFFPHFETNLLFLKYYKLRYPLRINNFFNVL